jgi:heat shock protein HslJ
MKSFIATAIVASSLVSCAAGGSSILGGKLGGEWSVVSIDGKTINAATADTPPYMGFDVSARNVYGNAGCNLLTGALDFNESQGTINLNSIGSTRMMCADMTVEDALLGALRHVRKYSVKGDTLSLNNSSGKAVVTLVRK